MQVNKNQQHAVGDRIVEAFTGLDCVQEQIPAGFSLHVQVVWDNRLETPMPGGMLMELKPQADVPGDAMKVHLREACPRCGRR